MYEPEGTSYVYTPRSRLRLTAVIPNQVWNTPFWRRALIAGVGVVAFYKYAPAPGDENPIAKYITKTMTPAEVWSNTSFSHLAKSAQISDDTLLMGSAKPPVVHRYRYPQCVPPSCSPIHMR